MKVEIHVYGLEELRDALMRKIPMEMQGKVLQKALAAGSAPIIERARSLAPDKTGALRKAIYARRDRTSRPTFESRLIGVSSKRAFYWRFIEFGHAEIHAKKTASLGKPPPAAPWPGFFGKVVKAYPPHPFIRPAYENLKQLVLAIIIFELAVAIDLARVKASWSINKGAASARAALRAFRL